MVSLVGLPGSGKSTVSRHLAEYLGYEFQDSDKYIELAEHQSISDIFARSGEAYFRDAEEGAINQLTCSGSAKVIATGGGSILREANRLRLSERTTVVYLHASPDELFRRLKRDRSRPLLQVGDPQQALQSLYELRDPLYREIASFVVDTGKPTVLTLVDMICAHLDIAKPRGSGGY